MGIYNFRREFQKISKDDLLHKLQEKHIVNNEQTLKENMNIKDSKGSKIQFYDDGFSFKICVFNAETAIVKEEFLQKEKENNVQHDLTFANNSENSDSLVF